MKNLTNSLILLTLATIMFGCAKPVEKTYLKVSLGAITGSANFPGGLYVMGQNPTTGVRFLEKVPDSDELLLELDNGTWQFATVGWDGTSGNYEGNMHCDYITGVQLNGSDFSLAMNATQAKCVGFNDPNALNAGQVVPLKFFSCLDIKPHLQIGEFVDATMDCQGGGDEGGTASGGDVSFKVSILTKSHLGVVAEGLDSACVNGPGTASSFKIPTGSSTIKLAYRVRSYSGAGCTGTETVYTFDNGLIDQAVELNLLGQSAIDPAVSVNLYLHVDTCTGGQLTSTTASPFAVTTGSNSDYHIICTPEQFTKIGTNGTTDHTFEVVQDLDFSTLDTTSVSSYAYAANPFGGSLRGQFSRFKNGDRALFDIIQAPSGANEWSYTGNVIIENFVISKTLSMSNESFGIFANRFKNYTSSSEIEVGDIYIDRYSSLTVTGNYPVYVGSFAGLADHNGSSRSYIRRVQSLADVKLLSNTDPNSYVGGLVGKAISQTPNYDGLYLELNDVGKLNNPMENMSDAKQVVLEGYYNVGGIAGALYGASLRGVHTADTKITAHGYAGGIIGSMDIFSQNGNNLSALDALLEFVPANASTNYVGGIVGEISQTISNSTFFMAAANSDVFITDNGNSINYFGGLVGKYYTTGFGDLKIYNSRANLDVISDGDYHGGLVGYYSPTNIQPGFAQNNMPAISYSLAQGYLGDYLVSGMYRGGLVGYGVDVDIFRSVANAEVYGESRLGGAFGYAQDSVLLENYINGYIEVTGTSSSSTFVGGVVGDLNISNNLQHNFLISSKSDVAIAYPNTTITSCAAASCGIVIGNLGSNASSSLTFYSMALGTIDDSTTTLGYETCGSQYGGGTACPTTFNSGSVSRDFQTQSSASSFACTVLGSFSAVYDDGTECSNLFEYRWREYGYDATNSGFEYLGGNQLEPFLISSVSDWNNLSDDSFLMSKSFALAADLDFSGITLTPIGSQNNPFAGALFSNGYTVNNIAYTATSTAPGIIPYLESGAMIGNGYEPFEINSLDINCGSESNCGFIGTVVPPKFGGIDAQMVLRVEGGEVYGSSDCMGGFIGKVAGGAIRFEGASYTGYVDSTSGQGVGGFIGCVGGASAGSGMTFENRININDSYADLLYLRSSDKVGGFIGSMTNSGSSSTTYFEARRAYVVLDKNNAHAGSDIAGTSYIGGMVGAMDFNANQRFRLERTYVDTSTAQVPTAFKHMVAASTGTWDNSTDSADNNAIMWNSNNGVASGFNGIIASNSGLSFVASSVSDLTTNGPNDFQVHSDGHSDWWIDPNDTRVLKFWWQNPASSGWR